MALFKRHESHETLFYKTRQSRRSIDTVMMLSVEALHVKMSKSSMPEDKMALSDQSDLVV
jgi:hypothetical protein